MKYEIQFSDRDTGEISVASAYSIRDVLEGLPFHINDAVDNNVRVDFVDHDDFTTTVYCTDNLKSIKAFQHAFVDNFGADNYHRVISFARYMTLAYIKCKTADFDDDFAELDDRRSHFADSLVRTIRDLDLDSSSIEPLFTVIIYEIRRIIVASGLFLAATIDEIEILL